MATRTRAGAAPPAGTAQTAVPPSASGYFRVGIARVWPHAGFDYRPGTDITVDRALLELMLAEAGLVTSVAAAD